MKTLNWNRFKQMCKAVVLSDLSFKNRMQKLQQLGMVLGVEIDNITDPDDTYELTTDNVKKMLAIHMRFR